MSDASAIASPDERLWVAIITEPTLLGIHKAHTHDSALTISYFDLRPFSTVIISTFLLAK
jgi:hypothetical protein